MTGPHLNRKQVDSSARCSCSVLNSPPYSFAERQNCHQ